MHDAPEHVANDVRSVWSIHLIFKIKGIGMHAWKEVLSNLYRKEWLVLANVT